MVLKALVRIASADLAAGDVLSAIEKGLSRLELWRRLPLVNRNRQAAVMIITAARIAT